MADVTQDRVGRPVDAPPWIDNMIYDIERIGGAREPTIAPGTATQYWRGDKIWAELAADAVALVPAGGISAENMQAAVEELDADKLNASSVSAYMLTLLDDSNAAAARTTLGLGALAIRDTVNNDHWLGVDLAVANGGTGASTPAAARVNLGVQPSDNPAFTGIAAFDRIHATGEVQVDAGMFVGAGIIADSIRLNDVTISVAEAHASTHRMRITLNDATFYILLEEG